MLVASASFASGTGGGLCGVDDVGRAVDRVV